MTYLLTNSNRELAASGIFTWSMPAFSAVTSTGRTVVTCPNAGVCADLCYARSGTYQFSNVKKAHVRNLEMVLDDLDGWKAAMLAELTAKRYQDKNVRIHDSGDFFRRSYLEAWIDIARQRPSTFFYAYTKEVRMVKGYELPSNLVIIYSMGGKQDHLIDVEVDRHADVFPTLEALLAAGYTDQEEDDLLAATLPTNKIGIVANNIPHLRKRQGGETFSSLQIGSGQLFRAATHV